jgi:ABC-type multidrug transport system permease subunit
MQLEHSRRMWLCFLLPFPCIFLSQCEKTNRKNILKDDGMETLMDVLKVLIIITLILGLFITARLGKNQRKGENEVGEGVVNHPTAKNPVFLTYMLFTIITLALIFIVASYFN